MTSEAHTIVTLTINPAIDISTDVDEVTPEHKLRCGHSHHEPGGGGINVARVAKRLGGDPLAIYAAGGPSGEAFANLFTKQQVPQVRVPIAASTRESFTVTETSTGKQYRFVLEGPELVRDEWQSTLDALDAALSPETEFVVASGSLPPGVPTDYYARVARIAKAHGVRCVVDASGDALTEALTEGVFMVKPSLRELEDYIGHELSHSEAQREAARSLVDAGGAELVAVSLGPQGALAVTADTALRMPAVDIPVRGTVGAGDSFVAGMVTRLADGADLQDALITGIAAGSATAACASTSLADAALVRDLEEQLRRQLSQQ